MSEMNDPRAFVIGWPIEQSKSPLIHNHWLKDCDIPGSYQKIAVEPEKLGDFMFGLREMGFVGGNVTIPHKQAILSHVDIIHPVARKLGAANTIWLEDGSLHADNTDGYGFLANLDQGLPDWDKAGNGKAVVLGAGGAARPIIYGLLERGFKNVTLVNRTRKRAEELKNLFSGLGYEQYVTVAEWEQRSECLENTDLLVNASSLGMVGQPALEMSLQTLSVSALVTDIVYNPLETDLLTQAKRRGNPVVDGLGMLLHQAVPGFEHWFGKRPSVSAELRQLVLAEI